ncbi:MAG: thiaminase II, partial [Staphylococcus sp.]|nr:thiaminase II [Staphylococcus sp.]
EKKDIKESFLQSTIHERNFFNMAYINEQWNFGGDKNA